VQLSLAPGFKLAGRYASFVGSEVARAIFNRSGVALLTVKERPQQ
jgi:hypothetical protein